MCEYPNAENSPVCVMCRSLPPVDNRLSRKLSVDMSRRLSTTGDKKDVEELERQYSLQQRNFDKNSYNKQHQSKRNVGYQNSSDPFNDVPELPSESSIATSPRSPPSSMQRERLNNLQQQSNSAKHLSTHHHDRKTSIKRKKGSFKLGMHTHDKDLSPDNKKEKEPVLSAIS
eukprot:UN33051